MSDFLAPLSIPPWYELPSPVRSYWDDKLDLLVPAPPLFTEIAGPAFNINNYDPHKLAQELSHDALLAGRMLAVVNSARFGQAHPVTSLERAMIVLGFNLVRSIIISFLMDYRLGVDLGIDQPLIDLSRRWSAGASVIAYNVAQAYKASDPAQVATVALLARVGSLALGLSDHPPQPEYYSLPTEAHRLRYELEAWKVVSSLLSAELINHWDIPEPLPDLVEHTWRPLASPQTAAVGDPEEVTLLISAVSLVLAYHYLHEPQLEITQLLECEGYEHLRFNLTRAALEQALATAWSSPRLQRELAAVVE